MSCAVTEPRSFPLLSSAYDDLAVGLRALAADLGSMPTAATDEAEATSPGGLRDVVNITARGMGGVFLQVFLAGVPLMAAFQVWIALFPPLRPTV
jgi:hypothetical protein